MEFAVHFHDIHVCTGEEILCVTQNDEKTCTIET